MLSGSVRISRPSPPGNSRLKTRSNWTATSWYASVKTRSIRSSTSRMMSSRSRFDRLRSSSWVVRNVCRSSRAVNSSRASGLIRPSAASRRSPLRSRFSWVSRTYAWRLAGLVAALGRWLGYRLVRPELLDERRGVDAELLDRPGLELLDPQPLLGARDLVAVDRVGQLAQLVLEDGDVAPQDAELRVARGPGLLGPAAQGVGLLGGPGHDPRGVGGAHPDGLGHLCLAQPTLPARLVPGAGLDLRGGGGLQRGRAVVQGPAALLPGPQRQPQLGLVGARPGRLGVEAVALGGGGVVPGFAVVSIGGAAEPPPPRSAPRAIRAPPGRRPPRPPQRRCHARCARPRPGRCARPPRARRASRRPRTSSRRSRAAGRGPTRPRRTPPPPGSGARPWRTGSARLVRTPPRPARGPRRRPPGSR